MTASYAARPVALGARLSACPQVNTLGFKPNFSDYTPQEQAAIRAAPKVYYPTAFYADLFNAMGKPTFPSFHTYKFAQDKIRQTAIFEMKGIPHPKTRVFYGKKQKRCIPDHFCFPFVAKIPRGSARGTGVFLIENPQDLATYLGRQGPAYIQAYLPTDRDMRLVIIGNKIRLAFWRLAPASGFRTNISQGGDICFDPLPQAACALALETARACGWNDVGMDIVESEGRYYVLEANMKYGTKGFQQAGIDYKQLLASLLLSKEI
jgi:ribosomal protein S6--L-glutamate ligase